MHKLEHLIKLRDAVRNEDNRFSSYLPSGYERAWPQFYKAMDGSLDAAFMLLKALLPGWDYQIIGGKDGARAAVRNLDIHPGRTVAFITAPDPAQALLLAILEALIKNE